MCDTIQKRSCLDGNGGFSEQFCCGAFAQTNLRGGDTIEYGCCHDYYINCFNHHDFHFCQWYLQEVVYLLFGKRKTPPDLFPKSSGVIVDTIVCL